MFYPSSGIISAIMKPASIVYNNDLYSFAAYYFIPIASFIMKKKSVFKEKRERPAVSKGRKYIDNNTVRVIKLSLSFALKIKTMRILLNILKAN
jgi:hypothetical protein